MRPDGGHRLPRFRTNESLHHLRGAWHVVCHQLQCGDVLTASVAWRCRAFPHYGDEVMNTQLGSSGNPLVPDVDSDRPRPLAWQTYSDQVQAEWFSLLASDPDEPAVQQFLELHPSMIPGGSGDIGPGGHHGSDLGLVFR